MSSVAVMIEAPLNAASDVVTVRLWVKSPKWKVLRIFQEKFGPATILYRDSGVAEVGEGKKVGLIFVKFHPASSYQSLPDNCGAFEASLACEHGRFLVFRELEAAPPSSGVETSKVTSAQSQKALGASRGQSQAPNKPTQHRDGKPGSSLKSAEGRRKG